jgi:hypothetical protein
LKRERQERLQLIRSCQRSGIDNSNSSGIERRAQEIRINNNNNPHSSDSRLTNHPRWISTENRKKGDKNQSHQSRSCHTPTKTSPNSNQLSHKPTPAFALGFRFRLETRKKKNLSPPTIATSCEGEEEIWIWILGTILDIRVIKKTQL